MESRARDLLKRAERAKESKFKKESELKEAYKYILPIRDTLRTSNGESVQRGVIYDPTAKIAIEKYATKLQNLLTPAWEEWLKLQPGVDVPEDKKGEVQETLDDVSKIVFSHIHHSNFYTAEHESFLDLGISTGAIVVERNTRKNEPSLINCRSIPISELIPENSSRGTIDTVWREFQPKVKEIKSIWPNADVPTELMDKADNNDDFKVTVYEGVVYNEDKSDYTFYVLEKSLSVILYEEQMDTSPFIVFRESVRPGEVLGFGRGLRILEDIKTLNKLAENSLRADGFNTLPLFTAVDDGAFNPYNVVLQPGTIIPVSSNDNANPSLRPLPLSNNFQYAEARVDKLVSRVNEIFLANPFGSIEQTPVRSATEIAAREADLFQSTAAAFGRLQTEFLEPFMRRVVDILNKEGVLPPFRLNGREVSIKFTSPFSKMQGSEKVKNVMNWLGYIAPLGQEVMQLSVNLDKIPSNLAYNMGIDKELYKDDTELEMTKEQLAGAAAAYAQQGGELPMQGGQAPGGEMPLV